MDRATIRKVIIQAINDECWSPDDPEPRAPNYLAVSWVDDPNDPEASEYFKAAPRFDGNLPLDVIADAIIALFRSKIPDPGQQQQPAAPKNEHQGQDR